MGKPAGAGSFKGLYNFCHCDPFECHPQPFFWFPRVLLGDARLAIGRHKKNSRA